jgi:hypothetical protein
LKFIKFGIFGILTDSIIMCQLSSITSPTLYQLINWHTFALINEHVSQAMPSQNRQLKLTVLG